MRLGLGRSLLLLVALGPACVAGEFDDLPGCPDDGEIALPVLHNTYVYLYDEAGAPRCVDGGVQVTQGGRDQFAAQRHGTVTMSRDSDQPPTFVSDLSTRPCNTFETRISQAQCTNVPVEVRVDVPGCAPQLVSMTWRENVARYGSVTAYRLPITLRCGQP